MISLSRPRAFLFCALLLSAVRPIRADEQYQVAEFKARAGSFTAVAISNDGKLVLTGEDDGLVTLWSTTTGTSVRAFTGHPREVLAAALLPDGKLGVTCGDDDMVAVWDLATGARLKRMSTGSSIPLVMSCSADGSLAATGCDDGQIVIWDLATGRLVTRLRRKSPLCSLQFSPDGAVLAAGYMDGSVVFWDTRGWSQKQTLPTADGASVGALAFTADSRLLATGDQAGAGFVWNVADGKQASMFAGYANPDKPPRAPVAPVFPGSVITPDGRSAITYLCFNRDGSMLIGALQDAIPRFWDTKTGRFLGTADWLEDKRFYFARYGFTFATAMATPARDFIVTMGPGPDNENLADVWKLAFAPVPPQE